MPRKLKIPAKPKPPTKKVAEISARRTAVWRLMLKGVTNNESLREQLKKQDPPYDVSIDTICDDKRHLRAESLATAKEDREYETELAKARLDHIQMEFEKTAEDADRRGEGRTKVAAMQGARQTVMDRSKVAGIIVEKQEVSGGLDLHAPVPPEKLAAIKKALGRAKLDPDGKPAGR